MGFPRRFCCLHCCTVLHQGHSRMIKEAQNPGNTPHKSSFTFWPFLPIHLLLLVLSCLLYFVVISKRDGCSNLLYLGQQLKVTVDFAYWVATRSSRICLNCPLILLNCSLQWPYQFIFHQHNIKILLYPLINNWYFNIFPIYYVKKYISCWFDFKFHVFWYEAWTSCHLFWAIYLSSFVKRPFLSFPIFLLGHLSFYYWLAEIVVSTVWNLLRFSLRLIA